MKAKKWLTIITAICSVCSLTIALLFKEYTNYNYIYDIALAVFGSSLLGFLMSLIEYFVQRRYSMEEFWYEARKALKQLRACKPIVSDAPIDLILECIKEEDDNSIEQILGGEIKNDAKSALKKWCATHLPYAPTDKKSLDTFLEEEYSDRITDYKQRLDTCIKKYKTIAMIDLGMLGNAYANLDFIFANKRIRDFAYTEIYSKIWDSKEIVEGASIFFNHQSDDYYDFCGKKVLEIQKELFSMKEEVVEGMQVRIYYQEEFDAIDHSLEDFRCLMYRKIKPEYSAKKPVLTVHYNLRS